MAIDGESETPFNRFQRGLEVFISDFHTLISLQSATLTKFLHGMGGFG
jgi:hypothetical protein